MIQTTGRSRLENKIILITGAGDGIGRALSLECADQGATVILLGKTVAKLEQVYDLIVEKKRATPAIYPLDLAGATPADYDDLHNSIAAEFGRLDGLVNHAGWLGASTPIQQFDVELWYKVLQVNLNAPFLLTRACIPLLTAAPAGSVLFTVERKNTAYWGAYGVAKSGLLTLMQILAQELESNNIAVNAVDPGAVRTRFRALAYPGSDPSETKKPEDVIAPYLHCLAMRDVSETGRIFKVDDFE